MNEWINVESHLADLATPFPQHPDLLLAFLTPEVFLECQPPENTGSASVHLAPLCSPNTECKARLWISIWINDLINSLMAWENRLFSRGEGWPWAMVLAFLSSGSQFSTRTHCPQGCLCPSLHAHHPTRIYLHLVPGSVFFPWLPFILFSFSFLRTPSSFIPGLILSRPLWTLQLKPTDTFLGTLRTCFVPWSRGSQAWGLPLWNWRNFHILMGEFSILIDLGVWNEEGPKWESRMDL
jgi:hypothetical protein